MNQQRRLIIKLLAVTGAAGVTGYALLRQQADTETNDATDADLSWLEKLNSNEQFNSLMNRWPDPYNALLSHIGASAADPESLVLEKASKQVAADFQQQQTIVLDHWHLSVAEVLMVLSAIQLFGVSKPQQAVERSVANAPLEPFITVEKWGPQETYQGVKFNEQPDGHVGFWVVASDIPDGLEVYIGGQKTNHFANERGFTSGIYHDVEGFINRVGSTEIMVYDTINHRKQLIGEFTVLPAFALHQYEDGRTSKVFSPIEKWGPVNALVGESFNEQPNGYAAFWFKVSSLSNQVKVSFNGHLLKATVRKDLITTSLPVSYLPTEPGQYPVRLISELHNESLLAGSIEIQEKPAGETNNSQ